MTTHSSALHSPAVTRGARVIDAESAFFARYATALGGFILLAFAQFDLRGMAPIARFGWEIHAHAATMVAWIGLSVAQPWLAASGNRGTHRTLGWASLAVLATVPVIGSLAGFAALRDGLVPPFFSPAYFLALVHVGVVLFTAMVVAAVVLRRRIDWHRRLMLGSTALLIEPALGRTLPMPLMGSWGEWVAMVIQIGALGFLAAHDRKIIERVHPATLVAMAAIVLDHVLFEALGRFPPLIAFANGIAPA